MIKFYLLAGSSAGNVDEIIIHEKGT